MHELASSPQEDPKEKWDGAAGGGRGRSVKMCSARDTTAADTSWVTDWLTAAAVLKRVSFLKINRGDREKGRRLSPQINRLQSDLCMHPTAGARRNETWGGERLSAVTCRRALGRKARTPLTSNASRRQTEKPDCASVNIMAPHPS